MMDFNLTVFTFLIVCHFPGAEAIRQFYIAFDILVVSLCVVSLLLCVRSVAKSIMLASVSVLVTKLLFVIV